MKKHYCLDCGKPVTFKQTNNIKEFKTSRAAVLSIEKLKERKLKPDYLISGQE